MKKQHWIALVASVIALLGFMHNIGYMGYSVLEDSLLILRNIAMVILPWVVAYKRKTWSILCAGVIALSNIWAIMLLPAALSYATGSSSIAMWFDLTVPQILAVLEVVFCILVVISFFKQVKPWILFFFPMVSLIFEVIRFGLIAAGPGILTLTWIWSYMVNNVWLLQQIVFFMVVYLLVNEAPERIGLKEKVQVTLSNGDETGYTYLDEYKKNMKK